MNMVFNAADLKIQGESKKSQSLYEEWKDNQIQRKRDKKAARKMRFE